MDYKESINYIENIKSVSPKPGLERMKILMKLLDNPQDRLKVIHVAGTNGKGSTCAMIESILRNSNYSTGLYTSPHLNRYNERIKINNIDISDSDFAQIATKVANVCSNMETHPSIFEFLTAIAFCYFESHSLDFVIMEVGLGGRFDSTNIIKSPILSIITSISIDHVQYLGNTVEQISKEKGGIIKKNCTVVLCFNPHTVYNIISDICKQKDSKLYFNHNLDINIKSMNLNKMVFSIKSDYYEYQNIILNMIGEYQVYNAATALTAIEALKDMRFNINDCLYGLEKAFWAGRMELVSISPSILLDGAHNIDGINMLIKYIKNYLSNKKITLLIGILKDKQYLKMINNISNIADRLVITQVPNSRTVLLEDLSDICVDNTKLYLEKNVSKALSIAKSITKQNEIIICSGSLYLIGYLRNLILKEE